MPFYEKVRPTPPAAKKQVVNLLKADKTVLRTKIVRLAL